MTQRSVEEVAKEIVEGNMKESPECECDTENAGCAVYQWVDERSKLTRDITKALTAERKRAEELEKSNEVLREQNTLYNDHALEYENRIKELEQKLKEKEKRIKDLEAQHKDLVERNAFLRQRHDLPADRIPQGKSWLNRISELEHKLDEDDKKIEQLKVYEDFVENYRQHQPQHPDDERSWIPVVFDLQQKLALAEKVLLDALKEIYLMPQSSAEINKLKKQIKDIFAAEIARLKEREGVMRGDEK